MMTSLMRVKVRKQEEAKFSSSHEYCKFIEFIEDILSKGVTVDSCW